MGVGLVRSLQPPDILWIHWRVYNFIANTGKGVLFLPPSDAYIRSFLYLLSIQFSSVAQSCPTLCDPMNCSTPGLPVQHQLPEFTPTHVHWVSDAIQSSHPLSSCSPPAPNPSKHQSLFQWVNSSHEVAKYWSFSFSITPSNEHSWLISFRIDCLHLLAVQGTLKSLLQNPVQKHQFFGAHFLYTPTVTSIHDYLKNHSFDETDIALTLLCWQSNVSGF